jgi:hypothetical protein
VIIVYRLPYLQLHQVSSSVFFEEFSTILEKAVMCSEPLLISGDFDFHLDDHHNSEGSVKFWRLLVYSNLFRFLLTCLAIRLIF